MRLLDRRVPLDEMAIAMFLDRIPVSEAAVRKALHSILADPKSENLDEEARADLADQRVNHLRRRARRIPLLQEWSRMARAAGNRGGLDDVVPAMMYAQSEGTFPSDEAVGETVSTLGGAIDDVSLFYQYQIDFGPAALREAIDAVTLQELRTAQSYLESLPGEILPAEARQNYRLFSLAVLYFAELLPTGEIETNPAVLQNIASLLAES
jgi:hypothetical protein